MVYYDLSGYGGQLDCGNKNQINENSTDPETEINKRIVQESKKTTGGQKKGSDTLSNNLVQRGITPEQAEMILNGQDISTPTPHSRTTPTQHVGHANHSRDPWISTTRSSDTAEYYATHVKGGPNSSKEIVLLSDPNPIIEIDLNKIDPATIVDVSTPENAQQLTTNVARNFAAADQEVLT